MTSIRPAGRRRYEVDLVVDNTAGLPVVVPVTLTVTEVTDVENTPQRLSLTKNYPNPFNPRTTIGFSLPAAGAVRLQIFDMQGRLVRTLVDGDLPAGTHARVWDGTDDGGRQAASGMFVSRLAHGDRTVSRKLMLMK